MQLMIIVSVLIVVTLWSAALTQVALAKHHDSDNKPTTTTDQPQTKDETDPAKDFDVPSVPRGTVIPGEKATTTTTTTTNAPQGALANCSNGSDSSNDKICVTETNQEQTTSTPQNTPTPQVNPLTNTEISENPISTSTIQQNDNLNDNSEQNPSSGSTSSSGEDSSSDKQVKGLGADSKFVMITQHGKISLFSIESNERELDTGVLPQTIRPVLEFDDTAAALQWITQYDNR